jgi:trans-aconitate 2-methyltransferase
MEAAMPDAVEPLVLDLLEWIGFDGRPYAEVMEAWRTSCPRLPVWEEANSRGFVVQRHDPARGALVVSVSRQGRAYLASRRSSAARQVENPT